MIFIIKIIAITFFLVMGYTIVTQEGMALYGIREWAARKKDAGSKWANPLFLCHWCQPSSVTIISFLIGFAFNWICHFSWRLLVAYPICVGGASILCGLTWAIHEYLSAAIANQEIQKKYYDNVEQLSFFDVKEKKQNYHNRKNEK